MDAGNDDAPAAAAIVIVGNEILSGATRDANAFFLARRLAALGICVAGISFVPDEFERIAGVVARDRAGVDYLLVCGGIGPTHDDLTREAVAGALGRRCVPHPDAETILRAYYGDRINAERLAMARLPEGCALIPNPRTGAPGFAVDGVFVFPGIPALVEAMFESIVPGLATRPACSMTIRARIGEGDFAARLARIQEAHPRVSVGSYPATSQAEYEEHRARIVIRGCRTDDVARAAAAVRAMLEEIEPGAAIT